MKKFDILVKILLILGGLVWGLVGFFNVNVVDYVFGKTWIDRVIYILVGLAALYHLVAWKAIDKRCCSRK